ncbi:hypothetical protein C8R44DRAFT_873006 [Mycena epipterygia]|nr:hypothetical protein C8R44DRAFT_873006 [Mycena epipterygia]
MSRLVSLALYALCITSLSAITGVTAISHSHSTTSPARAIAKNKYTTSHSLGDSYAFDSRDGWQTFNASNLPYKYRGESPKNDLRNNKRASSKLESALKQALTIVQDVGKVFNGLKGIGKPEPVVITWYTGHDLLNPSCWPKTAWAPTDESFVCALTLQGWKNKPECFRFLELCNSPTKCVYVRVVDTCAGCAKTSHHVDLTKGPFGQLASLDEGTLTVQLRMASEPEEWFEDLWGPQED